MDSIYLGDVGNPFNLPVPSPGWLQPIADYDPELRIAPSQTTPVYRLLRVARRTGATNAKLWLDKGLTMCADTVIAFQRRLVAITTIPAAAVAAPPEHVVQWLKDHDLTAHGGADAVCDRLEARDRAQEQTIDATLRDDGRQRHRAARIGYQYRAGSRVSLVRPIRRQAPLLAQTPAPDPAPVAPVEPSVSASE